MNEMVRKGIMCGCKGLLYFFTHNWLAFCGLLPMPVAGKVVAGVICVGIWIFLNICPSLKTYASLRLRILKNGCQLLLWFCVLCPIDFCFSVYIIRFSSLPLWAKIGNTAVMLFCMMLLYWNGIIRVYTTSVQLGIKWRVLGVLFGWIPIVNVFILWKIIRISWRETVFEEEKWQLDAVRAENEICHTKYPILLVHGIFFRDIRFFNYWGRIPHALMRNGAVIYYGEQESAASVNACGRQLALRIKEIVHETGCEKVNIIAHSKGGLDARCAISQYGMAPYVATLTTINTPHTGCVFAEFLLNKVPIKVRMKIANRYNRTLKKLGDQNPNFTEAVFDLTASRCQAFNDATPDVQGVYYQSVGSKMTKAAGGKFPLNFSYHLVKYFDGENDGLVSVTAMKWGEKFSLVNENWQYKRGISHGDMIDLNRENIDGFDVREFYVDIVHELKEKGF